MKFIAIIIFLAFSSFAGATSYYISPSGNDSNKGSISSPFFTLNKAWSVAKPGDIIYARGGTYRFSSRQNLTGKSGTSSDTIRIWAYPGERPVFTKSSSFSIPSFPVSLVYVKANYIHIRGIEIAYFTQATPAIWYGIAVQASSHNKFEKINSHHNGHGMVLRDECNDNLILNSDFHHNSDPLTEGDAYGNADGIAVAYQSSSMENTIRGCRMWNNSDDGLDLWNNNGNFITENCWSWQNGYRIDGKTAAGDGCGFKFGPTSTDGSDFRRIVRNNIAFSNRSRGYMQNGAVARFHFYNNVAWKNPLGVVFATNNLAHIFRNNIVFDNRENWNGTYTNSIRDHNSNLGDGPVATAADFTSLDTAGITKARKPNGELPDISFMKLASGSKLIDAGIDVGLAFEGGSPDLGAFEVRSGSVSTGLASPAITNPDEAPAPVFMSSVVESDKPDRLKMKYDLKLANILPPAGSFVTRVNGKKQTVMGVSIEENVVILTLAVNVGKTDTVTVAYSQPEKDPLQSPSGGRAASLPEKSVTNNTLAAEDDKVINDGKILIYPNPAKEYISIANYEQGDETPLLRLYDLSGKLCQEIKIENLDNMRKLPIRLVPGMYIAQLLNGSDVHYVQKLIVL